MSIAPSSLLESGAIALATMVKLFMRRNTRHPGKTFTDSAVRRRFGATTPNGTHLLNGTEFAETRAPARRPSSRMSDPKTILDATLTVVLAGGDGKRLLPLTEDRPKSALPIGGPFKLIDFTLSNCFNSGLRRLFLLTQYKSEALHCYIRDGWSALWYRPAGDTREYIVCLPPACGKHYRGTADAVFQNLQIITREDLQRSEEHTSELQSPVHLVCRLLLEKKKSATTDVTPGTI